MNQATEEAPPATAEDFIVGAEGKTFDRVAGNLRKFRHHLPYEPLIQHAFRYQSPKTVAQFVRASLWNRNGTSPETGYISSDYEDILRRDLLLQAVLQSTKKKHGLALMRSQFAL